MQLSPDHVNSAQLTRHLPGDGNTVKHSLTWTEEKASAQWALSRSSLTTVDVSDKARSAEDVRASIDASWLLTFAFLFTAGLGVVFQADVARTAILWKIFDANRCCSVVKEFCWGCEG